MTTTSSTRLEACARVSPSCNGPKAISSRTLGENTCASEFWKMNPTRARKPIENCSSSRLSSVTSAPKARYSPESGNTRPSSTLSRVDLPQPFAPSRATFSPGRTLKETPSSAVKRPR
jgi:hypothetical protein